MNTLGVDVAWSRSGWAVVDEAERVTNSGVIATSRSASRAARALAIMRELRYLIGVHGISLVAMEGHRWVTHRQDTTPETIMGLAYAALSVELACAEAGVPLTVIESTTWRRDFTRWRGRGEPGKPAVWRVLHLLGAPVPAGLDEDRPAPAMLRSAAADQADAMGIGIIAARIRRIETLAQKGVHR